ncbi:DUF5984 family protein [Asanoa siamensis]|uniref:Uncharacterized protein n=1 Tax=Asanoa siamensis TaxID=926357 RepID=A0ABQ4CWW7_9ACTN|nr:DUF5984 family protein [Asanoa siamensis]GIF75779.1 hypothetical protein Asi02nite_52970 [Asanoa siamensis]
MGYLTDAPDITCWRHLAAGNDLVTISQRIPPAAQGTFEGPRRLDVSVPTDDFFAAVRDFDRRFIAAMEERVAVLEQTGPPTDVNLDLAMLRAEHVRRSHWLAERLAAPRQVDWNRVRSGLSAISSWPTSESGT